MTEGGLSLVDTHAHVALPAFDRDRREVFSRAWSVGVRRVICPGVDMATSAAAVDLAWKGRGVGAAVGFHPFDLPAGGLSAADLAQLEELAIDDRVVAIGEIGLDYSRGRDTHGRQATAFRDQVILARSLQLPVIVHNREASGDVLEVLEAEQYDQVILHCFTGDERLIQKAIDHGWYIGVGGVATYGSGQAIVRLLPGSPRERLLIETDSPYLSPVPLRGKRNEPANVIYPLRVVAQALDISVTEGACLTTANALSAFPRLNSIDPMVQE